MIASVGENEDAVALRRSLGLPPDTVRAVLVDEDGNAKLSASAPIAARRLFSTIDAMPMRRDAIDRRSGPRHEKGAARRRPRSGPAASPMRQ